MNSAAHVVSNTWKFDGGLSRLMHDELHWLDVTDRVQFKLAVLMYRCLHGMALLYLMDSCTPTAEVAGRQHLRSARQWKLIVPRYRLNSFGRRYFAVAGPSTWNSLPDSLRDPALSLNIFRRQLKTHFFCEIFTRCTEHIRDFFENALYKFTLYLLTYYPYKTFALGQIKPGVFLEK